MERAGGSGMSWQGWIFMLMAWGLVGFLFFYSFYHILFDERIENKKTQKERKKQSKE
jgi:hypothetical protein